MDNLDLEQKVNEFGGTEQINKENPTVALTDTIKYIIDKLLLKERELSKKDKMELENLLVFLEDIKKVTKEYAEFFEENKEEVDSLIKNLENINILSDDLNYSYPLINGIYSKFDLSFKELIDSLKNTRSFFKLSNFSDGSENKFEELLAELNNNKTPEEQLKIIKSDLGDLEKIVQVINLDINKYSSSVKNIKHNIAGLSDHINASYLKNSKTSFFGGDEIDKVSFKFKDSEILPVLFNQILTKLPSDYIHANGFKQDLLKVFSNEDFELIKKDELIKDNEIKMMRDYHSFYKNLSKKYKKVTDTISKMYEKKEEQKRFEFDKELDEDKGYKINEIFDKEEKDFLEIISQIERKDKTIYKIKKDKTEVGEEKLINMKKKIFNKIYSIYEDINNIKDFSLDENLDIIENRASYILEIEDIEFKLKSKKLKAKKREKLSKELEKLKEENEFDEDLIYGTNDDELNLYYANTKGFNDKILELIDLVKRYENTIDEERILREGFNSSKNVKKEKFTNHYKIESGGQHGGITGFKKHELTKPAKVVGKTAREIIDKILDIAKKSKQLREINRAFPGSENTLEGNLIVLGPWGGGKTALLNELSYEKDIISIEANKSDIISVWYGETEKNIDKLWNKALELYKSTGKEVFIFLDEFDNYFRGTGLSCGGGPDIQKEFQTRLDGLENFEGVHIVGLSNVPHKIPIDIYRRMEKTYVLEELELSDKVDLFYSRLGNFPISDDLNNFLSIVKEKVSDDKNTIEKVKKSDLIFQLMNDLIEEGKIESVGKIKYDDYELMVKYYSHTLGFGEEEAKMFEKMFLTTPKILYQVTERLFKNYISKIDKGQRKELTKKLKKINNKKKVKNDDIKNTFSDVLQREMTLEDFGEALREVFSNASVKAEIKGNSKFYTYADDMLNKISSNAFDGFDNDDEGGNEGVSFTINMKKGGCSDGSCGT